MSYKKCLVRFASSSVFAISMFVSVSLAQGEAGSSRFSENHYIEYIVGNLPIVISSPHGGNLKPSGIPNRRYGRTVRDSYTDLLARDISEAFYSHFDAYPHVIICRLSRMKLDCNRPVEEAAQGSPEAIKAWNAFHAFIDEAKSAAIRSSSKGIYIDLHGHGHSRALQELGYNLGNRQLQLKGAEFEELSSKSSIRKLASRSSLSFEELLRGPHSFGGILEAQGYPCVPSPLNRDAGTDPYFGGGYNTWRHCSNSVDSIYGFQIETPYSVRRNSASRKAFAAAFVESVVRFLLVHEELHFGDKQKTSADEKVLVAPSE